MNIHAIVAARMTSTRLPGKVLLDLGGEPALSRLIDRLSQSKYLTKIIIATTVNETDDAIEQLAISKQVGCFRGSETDVLSRTVQAAEANSTDYIVQVTGDCPLIDARTIDQVIEHYIERPYLDYVTNQMFLAYPLGFSVEMFRTKTLREVDCETLDPKDREHVSLYIYEHADHYHLSNIEPPLFLRHPEYRLTLDTAEDYRLINEVFNALYPINQNFDLYDIVKFLEANNHLLHINTQVRQKKARE